LPLLSVDCKRLPILLSFCGQYGTSVYKRCLSKRFARLVVGREPSTVYPTRTPGTRSLPLAKLSCVHRPDIFNCYWHETFVKGLPHLFRTPSAGQRRALSETRRRSLAAKCGLY